MQEKIQPELNIPPSKSILRKLPLVLQKHIRSISLLIALLAPSAPIAYNGARVVLSVRDTIGLIDEPMGRGEFVTDLTNAIRNVYPPVTHGLILEGLDRIDEKKDVGPYFYRILLQANYGAFTPVTGEQVSRVHRFWKIEDDSSYIVQQYRDTIGQVDSEGNSTAETVSSLTDPLQENIRIDIQLSKISTFIAEGNYQAAQDLISGFPLMRGLYSEEHRFKITEEINVELMVFYLHRTNSNWDPEILRPLIAKHNQKYRTDMESFFNPESFQSIELRNFINFVHAFVNDPSLAYTPEFGEVPLRYNPTSYQPDKYASFSLSQLDKAGLVDFVLEVAVATSGSNFEEYVLSLCSQHEITDPRFLIIAFDSNTNLNYLMYEHFFTLQDYYENENSAIALEYMRRAEKELTDAISLFKRDFWLYQYTYEIRQGYINYAEAFSTVLQGEIGEETVENSTDLKRTRAEWSQFMSTEVPEHLQKTMIWILDKNTTAFRYYMDDEYSLSYGEALNKVRILLDLVSSFPIEEQAGAVRVFYPYIFADHISGDVNVIALNAFSQEEVELLFSELETSFPELSFEARAYLAESIITFYWGLEYYSPQYLIDKTVTVVKALTQLIDIKQIEELALNFVGPLTEMYEDDSFISSINLRTLALHYLEILQLDNNTYYRLEEVVTNIPAIEMVSAMELDFGVIEIDPSTIRFTPTIVDGGTVQEYLGDSDIAIAAAWSYFLDRSEDTQDRGLIHQAATLNDLGLLELIGWPDPRELSMDVFNGVGFLAVTESGAVFNDMWLNYGSSPEEILANLTELQVTTAFSPNFLFNVNAQPSISEVPKDLLAANNTFLVVSRTASGAQKVTVVFSEVNWNDTADSDIFTSAYFVDKISQLLYPDTITQITMGDPGFANFFSFNSENHQLVGYRQRATYRLIVSHKNDD